MFGPDAPPAPWDTDGKYKLGAVEMYYMANAARAISEQELAEALHGGWPEGAQHSEVLRYGPNAVRPVLVDPEKTLGEVLKEDGHVVPGVPVFFVLARGSEYRERFLESV